MVPSSLKKNLVKQIFAIVIIYIDFEKYMLKMDRFVVL